MYDFDYLKERPETRAVTEARMEITKAENVSYTADKKIALMENKPCNKLGVDIVASACKEKCEAESKILVGKARLKKLQEEENNMYESSAVLIDEKVKPRLESIMENIDTLLDILADNINPKLQKLEDDLENIEEVLLGGWPEDWIGII